MANINWPTPSYIGQQYTSPNGNVWTWTGTYWESNGLPSDVITGAGASNRVALWNDSTSITYNPGITWGGGSFPNISLTGTVPSAEAGTYLNAGSVNINNYFTYTNFTMSAINDSNLFPIITLARYRGNTAGWLDPQNNDVLGAIRIGNYSSPSVQIDSTATESHSGSIRGGKLEIKTRSNSNSILTTRMLITGGTPLIGALTGTYGPPSFNILTQTLLLDQTPIMSSSTGLPIFGLELKTGTYYRSGALFRTQYAGSASAAGIVGEASGNSTGSSNIGIQGLAGGNSNANVAVNGILLNNAGTIGVAGEFEVDISAQGPGSYALRVVDGNEALGRVLKSVDSLGYAQWDIQSPSFTAYGSTALGVGSLFTPALGLTASTQAGGAPFYGLDSKTKIAVKLPHVQDGGLSGYNPTTGVWTVPNAGWYVVTANISLKLQDQFGSASNWNSNASLIVAIGSESTTSANVFASNTAKSDTYSVRVLSTTITKVAFLNTGDTLFLNLLLRGTQDYYVFANDAIQFSAALLTKTT